MKNKDPITRLNFIRGLMDAGLSFEESVKAYNAVMSTIANGVVNGQKIYFGNVGCLVPTVQPPRQVRMGFERKKGGVVVHKIREFSLDSRLRYKFNMFDKFCQTHELNWLS